MKENRYKDHISQDIQYSKRGECTYNKSISDIIGGFFLQRHSRLPWRMFPSSAPLGQPSFVFVKLSGWENFGHEPDSLEEFLEEPGGHDADDGTPRDRDDAESQGDTLFTSYNLCYLEGRCL